MHLEGKHLVSFLLNICASTVMSDGDAVTLIWLGTVHLTSKNQVFFPVSELSIHDCGSNKNIYQDVLSIFFFCIITVGVRSIQRLKILKVLFK